MLRLKHEAEGHFVDGIVLYELLIAGHDDLFSIFNADHLQSMEQVGLRNDLATQDVV